MNPDDDWFGKAAEEASRTKRAAEIRAAEVIKAGLAGRTTSAKEAAEAMKAFGAAAKSASGLGIGIAPKYPVTPRTRASTWTDEPYSPRLTPQKVDPEAGLAAIVDAIKKSDDPFAASGHWLTRITTAISDARREAEAEADD